VDLRTGEGGRAKEEWATEGGRRRGRGGGYVGRVSVGIGLLD
jgi:hypothetical protein